MTTLERKLHHTDHQHTIKVKKLRGTLLPLVSRRLHKPGTYTSLSNAILRAKQNKRSRMRSRSAIDWITAATQAMTLLCVPAVDAADLVVELEGRAVQCQNFCQLARS